MRYLFTFFSIFFLILLSTNLQAQNCPGMAKVEIRIKPDNRPLEIYWELVSVAGDTLAKGNSLGDTLCLPDTCTRFVIHDRGNNGLCCTNGNGNYQVWYNGILVKQNTKYTSKETTWLGCGSGCQDTTKSMLRIYVDADNYPQETSWDLLDLTTGDTLAKGKSNNDTLCISKNACLKFAIHDTYGDGKCCNVGTGGYRLYVDSTLAASGGVFTFHDTRYLNCPPGENCGNAITASLDTFTTIFDDTWYRYVPDTTGMFDITTCNLANACSTKIWVYDYCTGLVPAEDNTATMAYSTTGCGQNATLSVLMVKSKVYFIRIGDRFNGCVPDSIHWAMSFIGPISGCMDSLSCNFNPLATLNDPSQCLYNPDTACPDRPDLMVVSPLLKTSMKLDSLTNNDPCTIQEGCIKGYGKRYIVRFDTRIENIGAADYYIGKPPVSPTARSTQWIWDPCHAHWHYKGYAEYILFDQNSNPIPAGFKAGFCVMDLNCGMGGGIPKYNCSNQGISKQCGDIYSSGLKCQWIDITDVDTGRYTMVVRVNWDNSPDILGRIESNTFNNWGQVCLKVKKRPITGSKYIEVLNTCNPYVDCDGMVFGPALMDCNGVCHGPTITGNQNADSLLNIDDYQAYLNGVQNQTMASTTCNDLSGDQRVNVLDLHQMATCMEETPADGNGSHDCEFKPLIYNSTHTVSIAFDTVNLSQGYADLKINNPEDDVVAFEFKISGLLVDSVRIMDLGDSGKVTLGYSPNGRIYASLRHNQVSRQADYHTFMRVYFDTVQGSQVCFDSISSILNRKLEIVNQATGPCKNLGTVTFISQGKIKQGLRIVPNPMRQKSTVCFHNPGKYPYQLQITDLQGKVLQVQSNLTQSQIEVDRKMLSSGIYLFRLIGPELYQGKLVVED